MARSMQVVGLQGSVAKEPHGANRTPEVCGELVDLFTNMRMKLDYNHNFGCQLDDTFSSAF